MRWTMLLAFFVAPAARAGEIIVESKPTSVKLYPEFAEVTRAIELELGAGIHELIFPDLPAQLSTAGMGILIDGAQLVSMSHRVFASPHRNVILRWAHLDAENEVDDLKEALDAKLNEIGAQEAPKKAAEAKVALLRNLAESQFLPDSIEDLKTLAGMIENETLAAQERVAVIEQRLRVLHREREKMESALANATELEARLAPADEARSEARLSIELETPTRVTIALSYPVSAKWYAQYEAHLDAAMSTLRIERSAVIENDSGEDWREVDMPLSK